MTNILKEKQQKVNNAMLVASPHDRCQASRGMIDMIDAFIRMHCTDNLSSELNRTVLCQWKLMGYFPEERKENL